MNPTRYSPTKRKTKIPVTFEVEYEVHPLQKFQEEGHFVPAMRQRDAQGNPTMQPRKWKGTQVHCLTLFGTTKNQLLRALADSRAEAESILSHLIREGFYGAHLALEIAQLNAEQAQKSKDERDRLAGWMLQYHPAEFARVLGIAEAAVEEFQRKEAALTADPSPITNLLRQGAD